MSKLASLFKAVVVFPFKSKTSILHWALLSQGIPLEIELRLVALDRVTVQRGNRMLSSDEQFRLAGAQLLIRETYEVLGDQVFVMAEIVSVREHSVSRTVNGRSTLTAPLKSINAIVT